jgi:hypothetical protein
MTWQKTDEGHYVVTYKDYTITVRPFGDALWIANISGPGYSYNTTTYKERDAAAKRAFAVIDTR